MGGLGRRAPEATFEAFRRGFKWIPYNIVKRCRDLSDMMVLIFYLLGLYTQCMKMTLVAVSMFSVVEQKRQLCRYT